MSGFRYGDQVQLTCCRLIDGKLEELWWEDVYTFLCRNTKGVCVLEDPETGQVFTAESVRAVNGPPGGGRRTDDATFTFGDRLYRKVEAPPGKRVCDRCAFKPLSPACWESPACGEYQYYEEAR